MSAGTTVVFTADLTQVYAAFAAFQAYVRANPVQVGGGFGAGAGGSGTVNVRNTYNYYIQNYNAGGGGGGGGGGGQGGGGGGGRGGGVGGIGLSRLFGGAALLHTGLRLANDEDRYDDAVHAARGDYLKLAQAAIQRQRGYDSLFFGAGRVGRFARESFGSGPSVRDVEDRIFEAQASGSRADSLEKAAAFSRQASFRLSESQAGPRGSVNEERQAVENRYQAELDKIKALKKERLDGIEAEKRAAIEAAQPTGLDRIVYEKTGYLSAERRAIIERAEREAEKNAVDLRAKAGSPFVVPAAAAEAARKVASEAIDYKIRQETIRARGDADVARLEYERKPDVADVVGTYNSGRQRIESLRRAGYGEAADAETEALQYKIRQLQFKFQFGGNAEAFDPFSQDFGQGSNGYAQNDPLRTDDLKEAIEKGNELLQKLVDKVDGL